jgi:AbrB family looped-hinge helix DNA binding protein
MWHYSRMEAPRDPVIVEVGAKGRLVIPAPIREALGITEGTRLVARVVEGALILVRREVVRDQLLAAFRGVSGSLSDELLKERHDEVIAER